MTAVSVKKELELLLDLDGDDIWESGVSEEYFHYDVSVDHGDYLYRINRNTFKVEGKQAGNQYAWLPVGDLHE